MKPRAAIPRPLRHGFSHFLSRRRRLSQFSRHALLNALAGHGPAPGAPQQLTHELLQVSRDAPEEAMARLRSHPAGLTAREAAARLARHGANEIARDKPYSAWRQLWLCFKDPFNLLLTVLATVSYVSGDAKATVVIGFMVLLSTGLRFVQEGRSHRAAEALRAMVSNTATVLRQGSAVAAEIPVRKLVPGDLVKLAAGDMVPADCRVLSARDLFIAQSAMTGEALPVEKFVHRVDQREGPLEQSNLLFMGTNVVSGSATALVVATGASTYFGTLAARSTAVDDAPNAFQAGVNSVSWLLIRFALVMVPIVLLVNGFTKGNWGEALLFALSVAVGLTPEMLPMVVTSTLAKGAVLLSRRKVVVKRLDAIQNFGAMDVLCTDKTGTLTQDKVALARRIDAFGAPSDEVLQLAFLNSHYQTGLKNLLDRAVLDAVPEDSARQWAAEHGKVDELPFDFQRRRMSVVVGQPGGAPLLICKGAVEEMLAVCTQVRMAPPGDQPERGDADRLQPTALLDASTLARVQQVTQGLARDGVRVVAVACRQLPVDQQACTVADECGLTLVGFIAFLDPPKDSAAPALLALAAHGIEVKVLTGDSDLVTACVCRQVGLAADKVLLGAQVEAMDDARLALAVEQHRVFAKLTPLHKERIVRALRANGHVVGFMGDGINDAPALRAADIGVSVDTAVDIAKEAADIILLEKSLLVLDEGVMEGRRTFSNMLKYIRMTASSNFGNVFSVLVASAFLPFLPMLPLHLLVQNLLYDISQTAIPFDHVDAELIAQPLKWHPADIARFMVCFGPVSSVFDIATFAVMWWVFGAQTPAQQGLFQSGWFVVGLLTQTLVVHMLRTPLLPFVQSRPAAALLWLTGAIAAFGVFLPMGPLAGYLKLQPLPAAYFLWLPAILLGYGVLTTLVKRYYVRRHGWQ